MGDAIKAGAVSAAGVGATSAVVQSVAPDWTPVLNAVILACATLIPLIVLFVQAELRARLHSLEVNPVPGPTGDTGPVGPVGPAAPVVVAVPAVAPPTVASPTVEELLTEVLAVLKATSNGGK